MSDPDPAADAFRVGTQILAERDPVIASLAAASGPIVLPPQTESNFAALVRAITYQQLAERAAHAIHGRLVVLLGGEVTAERVASIPPTELRGAGLSTAKAASVLDLSAKVMDGSVAVDDASLATLSDDEIVANLSTVRGIGEWTAQIFALVHLGRPDVLPVGDLGIRRGYGLGWRVPMPTAKELRLLGEPYRPYRSVLAWYCWRADELYGGGTPSAVTGAASS